MATAAPREADELAAEEARLAREAASGDGAAFATLYERYERRAYNLALRVTGSEHDASDATQEAFLSVMRRLPKLGDRELAFGSYLFTATRNASYDLMQSRRRAQPSETISEAAAPVGSGPGGGTVPDPGDPEHDPDRRQLLTSQQAEIQAANSRLPERQREALALRELEELSYDEIAAIMGMNRNSVAQLISRARISLRDELRDTAMTSIVVSSPDCERALSLIAMRDDGQLAEGSGDATWLDGHLASCESCGLRREAMQEAGVSYRAWAPVATAPWLLREALAEAAELAGADWSEQIARAPRSRPAARSLPGMPGPYLAPTGRVWRRPTFLAAGLAMLLLGVGVVAVVADDDPPGMPSEPAVEPASAPVAPAAEPRAEADARQPQKKAAKQGKKGKGGEDEAGEGSATGAAPTASSPAAESAAAPAGAESKPGGKVRRPQASPPRRPGAAGVNAPQRVPGSGPKPPASTPPPEPPPPPQEPDDPPDRSEPEDPPETERPRRPEPREDPLDPKEEQEPKGGREGRSP